MKLQRKAFFKQSVASLAVLPFLTSTKSYGAPMGSAKFVDVDGISLYNIISVVVDRTQLHVFNHCGHYAFQEYPHEVTEQMVSFIKV